MVLENDGDVENFIGCCCWELKLFYKFEYRSDNKNVHIILAILMTDQF